MKNTKILPHHTAKEPPSPRLKRSNSGTPATSSLSEIHTQSPNYNHTYVNRSKSTTRSTVDKQKEYQKHNRSKENEESYIKFIRRNKESSYATPKPRSTNGSPSAWALSPGRCSPSCSAPELTSNGGSKGKSNGGGILKYFKQKKLWSQEEEFRRFRVLSNRLLQWRFVNARAEAAMAAVNNKAKEKSLQGWLRILRIRNSVVEKRIQVEKIKNEIKLFQILNPEICLLNKWTKMEGKYSEAIGKLERNLTARAIRLPLIQGAKAHADNVGESMSTAIGVMETIGETIGRGFSQEELEKTSFSLRELKDTVKQERECLKELEKTIPMVASLQVTENNLRVHLLQAAN